MLSYQHGYHAGNFADVIKHLTLSRLLNYMLRKDKPIFYLETHAGCGLYDLHHRQAAKTGEYRQGIELLWENQTRLSPLFSPYLQVVSKINPSQNLRFYPGSPSIAIHWLRMQDRLYCCELHPREFERLQMLSRQGKRVFYSHSDGIENLNALLPPNERRALIFIDPSYEIKTEYKQVPEAIKSAYQRFSIGTYCLWYPLVDNHLHQQLLRKMEQITSRNALRVEFYLTNTDQTGMRGCGLWIINPPYLLAEEMKLVLQQLCTLFNPGKSSFLIKNVSIKSGK
ncbi:23S rRNA (adenine(2030)-N(6))-methyltransferase RlmJ [Legionella fairfieldensis]|uniref:23S rRNA (adenine(2030)-N(6))-methyltransferase RlmJ n=1 Tax=Legionella fairfieldensis TaxID=45064 RepID=UPI00048B8E85|nr:23S rRNA (adenine(2030)-N(6))-methyltransferase RlmJ [Legionella fairfieldensis]